MFIVFLFFFTADFYGFFFHAIPEESGIGVLTLHEVHELVSDVWLTRHDEELEEERAARRKGRPKSTKEQKLEEVKLREAEEYRTGMGECFPSFPPLVGSSLSEIDYSFFLPSRRCDSQNQSEVPDLTHPENVALYRTWDQREVAFIQLLRFIRISSSNPDTAIVSRPGKHPSLVPQQDVSTPMDVEAGAQ
jgi:translation machinery-associated protein 16